MYIYRPIYLHINNEIICGKEQIFHFCLMGSSYSIASLTKCTKAILVTIVLTREFCREAVDKLKCGA